MADWTALQTRWATLSPGTTEQKLAQINAQTVVGPAIPMIIPTYRIYNLIDPAEFVALSASNQQLVRDILNMGTVDASPGTAVRARIVAVFPTAQNPNTRAALAALATQYDTPQIPWYTSVGYSIITLGDVIAAGLS